PRPSRRVARPAPCPVWERRHPLERPLPVTGSATARSSCLLRPSAVTRRAPPSSSRSERPLIDPGAQYRCPHTRRGASGALPADPFGIGLAHSVDVGWTRDRQGGATCCSLSA